MDNIYARAQGSMTILLGFLLRARTGELDLSLGVGFFDVLLKLAFYLLHERAWDRVWYGREVKADRGLTIALGGLVNIENT